MRRKNQGPGGSGHRRRDDIGVYSRRRAVPCNVDGTTSDAAKPAALTARGEAGANRIRAHITVTMLVDNKKKERKVWDLLRESLV